MKGALEQRWRQGLSPFDGQTIIAASEDLTPLSALRPALFAVVSRLHQHWPETALFTLGDWHEHDGFISEAKRTCWQSLQAMLISETSMFALSQGDSYVRRAFFPKPTTFISGGFYLRVYIPADYDNDYPERRGDFDVTCGAELAVEPAASAASASGCPLPDSVQRIF